MVSCLRAIVRSMLSPQTLRPGLKEMVLKGIRISADQPSSRRALSASQMPSQLRLELAGVGQALAAGPLGIDVEDVGVALVLERVEEDADEIVARDRRPVVSVAHVAASAAFSSAVVGHGVGRDAARLAVVAGDADIEAVAVVDDTGLRLLAGGVAGPRLDHEKAVDDRGGLPGGVVQAPVDAGPLIDTDGLDLLGPQGERRDGRGDDDEDRGEQAGVSAGLDVHVSSFELSFEILRSSIPSRRAERHRPFRRARDRVLPSGNDRAGTSWILRTGGRPSPQRTCERPAGDIYWGSQPTMRRAVWPAVGGSKFVRTMTV